MGAVYARICINEKVTEGNMYVVTSHAKKNTTGNTDKKSVTSAL